MDGTPAETLANASEAGEPVLARAFRILRVFSDVAPQPLSLARLAAQSRLPKTTVHRIANQLIDVGALERLSTGEYVIGLRLLEIASLGPRAYGLRAAALPYLQDLHRVTRQHVLLAVREGVEAVLVERLSSRDATTVKYRVGGRLPLTDTGIGIALLAYAPTEIRDRVLHQHNNSEKSAQIRKLLATVRREGVCSVTGPNPASHEPTQISSVAAPILTRRRSLIGAISLVTPEPNQESTRIALRTTSLAIARLMERQMTNLSRPEESGSGSNTH